MDKVSEMPELADVVPELVCLGIDAAICGVISPDSHLDFPQNTKLQGSFFNWPPPKNHKF